MVWAGIDTHTDTHTIALLDERGRPLGSETFAANPDGYDRLIDMLPGCLSSNKSACRHQLI